MKNRNFLTGFLTALAVLFLMGAATQNGQFVGLSKLDDEAVLGLAGTHNSLAYRVHEIEKHMHSNERWFALHGTPVGENTIMDSLSSEDTPFTIDAGNDTWGAWVQIVGGTDTPVEGSNAYFDLHRLEIVARETNNVTYVIQIGCDASGADALTNLNYTEVPYFSGGAQAAGGPVPIQMTRYAAGTKCWARAYVPGENTATISFYLGLHEYGG